MARKNKPIRSDVRHLKLPLKHRKNNWWTPHHLYNGSTDGMDDFECHASLLDPGKSPHPPHRHSEEEILLILDGEADLILPERATATGKERQRLTPGEFAYYPSEYLHTLEGVGDTPVSYLMFRWSRREESGKPPLEYKHFDTRKMQPKPGNAFSNRCVFEGATRYLNNLHCHTSRLPPGAGYEAHADPYDVAIYMQEGEVETLGQRVGPGGVIFYRAGEPHGMRNPGSLVARYLVFEFHSRFTNITPRRRNLLERLIGKLKRIARG